MEFNENQTVQWNKTVFFYKKCTAGTAMERDPLHSRQNENFFNIT
jgi:hypothetical protein